MKNFTFVSSILCALFLHLTVYSQNIKINEIVSANSTGILDSYGDYSDWIELKNFSDETINLEGYFLSDNPENPLKWMFPDVSIYPNGYLVVFASESNSLAEELHANFKISKEGEEIGLYNNFGVLVDRFDSVFLSTDVSYGRHPNQSDQMVYFQQPTPGSINSSENFQGVLEPAILSHSSGFYADPIQLSATHPMSNVSIRYTLDGTEPNENSPVFSNSMLLQNIENQDNVVSMIPTNPGFTYYDEGFTESRSNSRGWLPPYDKINKTNILKVKAYKDGYLPSESITSSFFINPQTSDRYQLPVVSLITEPDNFFSDEIGIYVYGTTGELGNYYEHGDEWERLTFMQFFDNDGEFQFEQNFGARTHGAGSRHSTIKNLKFYARDEYGKNILKYPFFNYADIDEFKRFMVRGPGHRPDCVPRDDFADLLLQHLNMDIQHIQPVIVFLNGEYWGIHTLKERFDTKYLELKYGKKDNDYVILRNSGVVDSGEEGDEEEYRNLLDFVLEVDMSQDENYEHVKYQIDIDNYLNYFTSEVFLGNVDWINTNIKFWRYKGFDKSTKSVNGLDGKWRWFLYDFDLTFGSSCNSLSPYANVLEDAFDEDYGNSTKLARGLKGNQQFVNDLVNKMCDRMNSNFSHRFFEEQIEVIDSLYSPHMYEHVVRWRYPSVSETLAERANEVPSLSKWNEIMEGLVHFNDNRKRKVIEHMTEEFDLGDTLHLELDVNDLNMGNIQVNSLFITEFTEGVSSSVYPWHGTYFEDVPFQLMAVPKLGYRFVEWDETGDTQDTLTMDLSYSFKLTAIFEEDPDFSFEDAIYINEFMASNESTIEDEFEAHADWIELFNPNNAPIDLASFYISDDLSNPYKYQFDRGSQETIIPAMGFKLIWCDERSERGVLHTNFKLNNDGEDLILTAPDSTTIDELSFGEQSKDISYGRGKDGDPAWKFFEIPVGPTPGATNNNASLEELKYISGLIYPNPVKRGNRLYLKEKFDIKLFDLLGNEIMQKFNVNSLETNHLVSGVYILRIVDIGNLKLIVE